MINFVLWILCYSQLFMTSKSQCPIENCNQCSSDDGATCDICRDGYFYDLSTQQCESCQFGCSRCSSPTACERCFSGFSFSNENCISSKICPKRTVLIEGQKIYCQSCPPNCYQCDLVQCLECLPGHFLNRSSCDKCLDHCQVCNNTTKCRQCMPGFSWNQQRGLCQKLPENVVGRYSFIYRAQNSESQITIACSGMCLQCTLQQCKRCSFGFYNDDGQCRPCGVNCKACQADNPNYCTSCYREYYLEAGKCYLEIQNCISYGNQDKCIQCAPRLVLNENTGECTDYCITNCQHCFNSSFCVTCLPGFIPSERHSNFGFLLGVAKCNECEEGCERCDLIDVTQCYECSLGYYLNKYQYCVPCPQKCSICSKQQQNIVCLSCLSKYILSEDGTCDIPCQFPCLTCEKGQPSFCISCYQGYSLNDKSCLPDLLASCKYSNDIGCLCPQHYVSQNSQCVACNYPFPNCNACSKNNVNICISCKTGYYLTESDCVECPGICQQCIQENHCTKCRDGYYIETVHKNMTGKCLACYSPCRTCEHDSTLCTSCSPGYWLFGHKCIINDYLKVKIAYEMPPCKVTESAQQLRQSLLDQIVADFPVIFDDILYNQVDQALQVTFLLLTTSAEVFDRFLSFYDENGRVFYRSKVKEDGPVQSTCGQHCIPCHDNCSECLFGDMRKYYRPTSCVRNVGDKQPIKTCQTENCLVCSAYNSQCVECEEGYNRNEILFYSGPQSFHEADCLKISCLVEHCQICLRNTNSKCVKCQEGFKILNNGTCIKIYCSLQNCILCEEQSSFQCVTCERGYERNENKQCIIIQCGINNCETCSEYSSSRCIQCKPGYEVSETEQCQAIGCQVENCQSCSLYSKDSCIVCNKNFELVMQSMDCRQVICSVESCAICDAYNSTKCIKCINDFELTENQQCQKIECIVQNCSKCSPYSKASCVQCKDSFELSDDTQSCMPFECAVENCEKCSLHRKDSCVQCKDNFELSEDIQSCVPFECAVANCHKCSLHSKDSCVECQDNFELSNNQLCLPFECVVANCDQCIPNQKHQCYKCSSNFTLSNDFQCLPPKCQISDCIQCSLNNMSLCKTCRTGFIRSLNSEACQQCENNFCKQCNQLNVCIECLFGIPNENGKCEIPSCNNTGQIFNGTLCTCQLDQYLSTSQKICVSCPENCYHCDNTGCSKCKLGFYRNNSLCSQCADNCLECVGRKKCETCQNGFYLVQNVCEPLPQNIGGVTQVEVEDENGEKVNVTVVCQGACQSCTNATNCTKCPNGYFLDESRCKICDSNCKTCETENPQNCLSCYVQYILDNKRCFYCPDNCLNCADKDFCSECTSGYFQNEGVCEKCTENCVRCKPIIDGATGTMNQSNCTKCELGFAPIGGNCVECLLGCSACNSSNIASCIKCHDDFYLDQNNFCTVCPKGCKSCSLVSSNIIECYSCKHGYILSGNNSCYEACQFPCHKCQFGKSSKCTSCYAGYKFNSNNNSCEMSTACYNNECIACPLNYVLKDHICLQCRHNMLNCDSCPPDNVDVCSSCKNGFYLTRYACNPCPNECETCTSQRYCMKCKNGYYSERIDNQHTGRCKECNKTYNCLTCEESALKCTSCSQNYELLSQKCLTKDYIKVSFVLDLNYEKITSKLQDFKSELIKLLEKTLPQVTVLNIKNGSVKIDLRINTDNETSAQSIKDTLQSIDKNGNIGDKSKGFVIQVPITVQIYMSSNDTEHEWKEEKQAERNDIIEVKIGIFALICASLATTLVLLAIIGIKVLSSQRRNKKGQNSPSSTSITSNFQSMSTL